MMNIEQTIINQLTNYFDSPAYKRGDEKRFTSLKTTLEDIATAPKGNRMSGNNLNVPSSVDISRITDCSTCPSKQAGTSAARAKCERFAKDMIKLYDPNKEVVVSRQVPPAVSGSKKTKKTFKDKVEEIKPKSVFFNIQAFK